MRDSHVTLLKGIFSIQNIDTLILKDRMQNTLEQNHDFYGAKE